MKDKELKLEEVKAPHTLGGASYILSLYINSAKEVVNYWEVELYKPRRYMSLTTDHPRVSQRLGLVAITNGPV